MSPSEPLFPLLHLLRGEIGQVPMERLRSRVRAYAGSFGDAKSSSFTVRMVFCGIGEHDVARLEIAMHDVLFRSNGQDGGQLPEGWALAS
jgi:hypothetical protein